MTDDERQTLHEVIAQLEERCLPEGAQAIKNVMFELNMAETYLAGMGRFSHFRDLIREIRDGGIRVSTISS